MRVWRITSGRFEAGALSGEGALQYGGRWNGPGRRVIYTAPSVAAAALEVLAHAGSVLERYVTIELDVPTRLVRHLDMADAPPDWQRRTQWCRSHGDRWADAASSVGLAVPSAVLGAAVSEYNVVLNVSHPDFAKVSPVRTIELWLDERLGRP